MISTLSIKSRDNIKVGITILISPSASFLYNFDTGQPESKLRMENMTKRILLDDLIDQTSTCMLNHGRAGHSVRGVTFGGGHKHLIQDLA